MDQLIVNVILEPELSDAHLQASFTYDQGVFIRPFAVKAHTHMRGTYLKLTLTSHASNQSVVIWKQNPKCNLPYDCRQLRDQRR